MDGTGLMLWFGTKTKICTALHLILQLILTLHLGGLGLGLGLFAASSITASQTEKRDMPLLTLLLILLWYYRRKSIMCTVSFILGLETKTCCFVGLRCFRFNPN